MLKNSTAISNDSPAPVSYNTSATERRGSARFEDKLKRSPSSAPSLNEDLAAYDCKDNELPKVLSFRGLYEETDDISSLELSYPSSMPS